MNKQPMKVAVWQPPKSAGWFQISGSINETRAGDLLAHMLNWASGRKDDEHPGTYVVYLDSVGGNVGDALAMRGSISMLRRLGHKVVIVILGRSSSCAVVIATAGDEVYMDEEAWIMIHAVESAANGTAEQIAAEAKYVKALNEQTFRLIATPYWSAKQIAAAVRAKHTLWLNPRDAWQRGMINGVLKEPPITIRVPKTEG